jgi:2-octaprenylphenol hydroxylase
VTPGTSTRDANDFDVVVAGGGLVGAAAALALVRTGCTVALIDRAVPGVVRGTLGFDLRTVALNPASANLLESVGVWSRLTRCPFKRLYVWEERGTRHIEFAAADVNAQALGAIVEVSPAVGALWEAIADEAEVVRITGAAIEAIEQGAEWVTLRTTGRVVRGRLVLAADGADSTIRSQLGGAAPPQPTGQTAIVTVAETQRDHADTAWQIFRSDGPVALLPLPARDGRHFVSVVWSQASAAAATRMQLDDAAFTASLEQAVEQRLGRIVAVDRRHSFPLQQRLAESFQPAPRVLLIGDAARVLHPLAGQGVNLGFEDVAGIVEVISQVGIAGIGADEVWRAFVRRRRTRAQIMLRAMDAFRIAYSIRDPGVGWLRNVAVDVLNSTPFIKRELMREALGLH